MIDVVSLSKDYGSHRAVDDLTFTAPSGSVTGFLGPNGAGKTTTLRCLLGLAEPTEGRALIDGRRYREIAAPRRTVGAVLESAGFHPNRSGRDHLRVLVRSAGLAAGRVDEVLDVVGLRSAADRRVGGYSLGMRQRLALAGALLGDPQVLVLDEPVNGLDPEGVAWVRRLLREWADEGRTVLVSSHLLAELAQVVDRVVVLREGRLVAESDLQDLADAVIVRVDRPDTMSDALRSAGVAYDHRPDGAIRIPGADAATVGRIAAEASVAVTELTRTSVGDALEAMFLAATVGADHG